MMEEKPLPEWTGRRKRQLRMTSEDTRDKVISTAVAMIHRSGLTVSLDHLSLEVLIQAADIPRSSFYNVWSSKEEMLTDVLVRLADPLEGNGSAFDPMTLEIAERVLTQHAEQLSTRQGRRDVLREAIRQGAKRNFDALGESKDWASYAALLATASGLDDPEAANLIFAALRRADERFLGKLATFFAIMLDKLEYELVAGITTEMVAAIGASVVEGLSRRHIVNPEIVDGTIVLPGIDGEPVEWHSAALGYWAIVESLITPKRD
jgi:AcrR family transcriptional regulator